MKTHVDDYDSRTPEGVQAEVLLDIGKELERIADALEDDGRH